MPDFRLERSSDAASPGPRSFVFNLVPWIVRLCAVVPLLRTDNFPPSGTVTDAGESANSLRATLVPPPAGAALSLSRRACAAVSSATSANPRATIVNIAAPAPTASLSLFENLMLLSQPDSCAPRQGPSRVGGRDLWPCPTDTNSLTLPGQGRAPEG